jgi:MoaA/NifB/PqqE/SkfB family radical SAM enzyme
MTQPQTAGHLDGAHFFRGVDQPGGFLEVQGWFCALGQTDLALSADLRVADSVVRIHCRDPRPDVAAANSAFSLNSGFNVIIPISADLHPDLQVTIDFLAGNQQYGSLVGRICHPEREIEQHAGSLSELRLKKLRNLVLNERERLSRTECTTSMPVTGQIDPAFPCNLECPLCLSEMARRDGYTMPIMKEAELDHILSAYGDHLIRIWLSLWGEPLLNKRLPELIAKCKSREIWVLISSNMSVPLSDAAIEALVKSGLDAIILSIDGATQETYQTYRRGGDLALVLDNVRRLVGAKRRLDLDTPHLYWRYLAFPWNRHEIEMAREMAVSLGVDEFGVEPGVMTPDTHHVLTQRKPDEQSRRQQPEVSALWQRHADARRERHQYFGCDYLYQSISINSNGLVHPCCYVVSPEHAVGHAAQTPADVRNGSVMRASQKLVASFAGPQPTTERSGFDPCLSCGVVNSTSGHIKTQSPFMPMYQHPLHGAPIRW